MITASDIRKLSLQYQEDVVKMRWNFHRYPELSMQEVLTAGYISETLKNWGVPVLDGVAQTGIVATVVGEAGSGKTIALRADMDALPLQEVPENEYKSRHPGIMHACGHDVHMASLLGTIKILNEVKGNFHGTVRCLFQPSEEKFPGGATLMIREGVLDNPKPLAIFGQHVLPELSTGKIGMRSGKYMASTDEIYLTIKGKGGHAATPELNIDPVVIAAHLVTALQQITSRYANSATPTLLSFGRMIADGRTNIIPDEVTLAGTFRTFDENWRKRAHIRITDIATTLAEGMGAHCVVDIQPGYPSLFNDLELTGRAFQYASEYLGAENVVELEKRMTAEDFAYYGQVIPGCFYRLGTMSPESQVVTNLHTPVFDVDEKALLTGTGLMAWFAIRELDHE